MRRAIVLMLVFGLASFAQGALIFTLNGEPQPAEIWLLPSEAVELDIEILDGSSCTAIDLLYEIVTPTGGPTQSAELITTGYTDINGQVFDELWLAFPQPWGIVQPDPQHVEISGSNLFSPIPGPALIMTNLVLHCLDYGDVVLNIKNISGTIVDGETVPPGTLMHTLTIHQIPEPMTMSILLLGSIFVLHRRRQT